MHVSSERQDGVSRRASSGITLELLQERFTPHPIFRPVTLFLSVQLIMFFAVSLGLVSRSFIGLLIGGAFGWLCAAWMFWEAGMFWGTTYTVVITGGEVIRVNRYPVILLEDGADVCVVVRTPGYVVLPRLEFVTTMQDFPYRKAFLNDPKAIVLKTGSANVRGGTLLQVIELARRATLPQGA